MKKRRKKKAVNVKKLFHKFERDTMFPHLCIKIRKFS